MNKFVIASCVLAVVALASTGEAKNACVERLVQGVGKTSIPEPIQEYVAKLEFELPVEDEIEWSELSDKERSKYMSDYPVLSCEWFDDIITEIFKSVLAEDDKCAEELEGNEEALKEARSDKILGPVMKAREACFAFEPHTRQEGRMI